MDGWMDALLIQGEIFGHPVSYTTCATHRHNIHKSHAHRENTFKKSGVVTDTRMVESDGVGVDVGAQ